MTPPGLMRRDFALLALFSFALFSITPLFGRMLSGHESVQPQTSREMFNGGGGWYRPSAAIRGSNARRCRCGSSAASMPSPARRRATWSPRFAAVLAAVPIVLLVAGIGSRLYGRGAGSPRASSLPPCTRSIPTPAIPEADIFLALIVTAVIAVFVQAGVSSQLQPLPRNPSPGGRGADCVSPPSPPGKGAGVRALLSPSPPRRPLLRPLGATNLAKGVIFGTAMAAIPVAGYLLWNRLALQIAALRLVLGLLDRRRGGAGLADRGHRPAPGHPATLEGALLRPAEPGLSARAVVVLRRFVPYVLLPWTLPALIGLWLNGTIRLRRSGPRALLWCWAILPPLVFSLSDGKHHHYLLQCIAPWAVLLGRRGEGDLAIPSRTDAQVGPRSTHPGRGLRRLRGGGSWLWATRSPRPAVWRWPWARSFRPPRSSCQPIALERQSRVSRSAARSPLWWRATPSGPRTRPGTWRTIGDDAVFLQRSRAAHPGR